MRNIKGQYTSVKSYWNKNRKKWLTIVCVTILASSYIFFISEDLNALYALTSPVEAHVEVDDQLEQLCSLPYVDCGTPEQMDMKEWVWIRLNQNLGYEEAVNGMDIIQCESNWNPDAMHVNTNKTVDLGLWQWNMPLHKNRLSLEQALNYQYSTDKAIEKFIEDGNWSAWVCSRILNIN